MRSLAGTGEYAFYIILWLLIISGPATLIRWSDVKTGNKESAVEIPEKRCDKGEISKEKYERMKENITERR